MATPSPEGRVQGGRKTFESLDDNRSWGLASPRHGRAKTSLPCSQIPLTGRPMGADGPFSGGACGEGRRQQPE